MKKKYSIGIDFGGTNIKIALLQNISKVKQKLVFSTKKYKNRSEVISVFADICGKFIIENNIKKTQIYGIGIGVAGPIDFDKGYIHYLTNVKGWKNTHLKEMLSEKIKLPVYVDNDVNIVTLGELAYGAGKGYDNAICLTLGTGVGGGIVINGHLYRGANFTAGEIGHIPINMEGPKCNCGGHACLERYVGNKYIVERAKSLLNSNKTSLILKLVDNDLSQITPKVISEAAKKKDKIALKIWREVGKYLGVALTGLVNTLNPEVIIIGGGVSNAGKPLFDAIKETVKLRAMENPASFVRIVPAKLGEKAGVIGASVLAVRGKNS
jgi:glucokinase